MSYCSAVALKTLERDSKGQQSLERWGTELFPKMKERKGGKESEICGGFCHLVCCWLSRVGEPDDPHASSTVQGTQYGPVVASVPEEIICSCKP